MVGDPRFVDEFGFNFHLQSSSPAIDKGNTAKAQLYDFEGKSRPSGVAADIGAYEVGGAAGTGTLAVSHLTSLLSVNLTLSGTRDWAKWPSHIHKATGGAQISDASVVGSGAPWVYYNDPRWIGWNDGTPVIYGSQNNGVVVKGIGNGFQFTVPAGTAMRQLVVYVGGWSSTGQLKAHLTDGSAPDYVNSAYSSAGHYGAVYTLTYHAASEGQRLVVTWTQSAGAGNVQLQAAALR